MKKKRRHVLDRGPRFFSDILRYWAHVIVLFLVIPLTVDAAEHKPGRSGEYLMPTICEFFGIIIRMYYDDHGSPHFHAHYGEHSAVIDIETLTFREGVLPRRAQVMVLEWAMEHREDLMNNWELARAHERLKKIAPLE
jgi:hypothetical protein